MTTIADKIICGKDDVILKKNKKTKEYTISFSIKNNKLNIVEICNFSLWKLLFKLNEKYIDDVMIMKEYDNKIDVIIVYKNIMNEYIKYCRYSYITITKDEIMNDNNEVNKIIFTSKPCIDIELIPDKLKNDLYKRVDDENDSLILDVINVNNIGFEKKFMINLEEDNLPIFVEDFLAKLLRKILLNLKVFIEAIDIENLNNHIN